MNVLKDGKIIIKTGMIWSWRTYYYRFAIRDVVFKRKGNQANPEEWFHPDCYWMLLE